VKDKRIPLADEKRGGTPTTPASVSSPISFAAGQISYHFRFLVWNNTPFSTGTANSSKASSAMDQVLIIRSVKDLKYDQIDFIFMAQEKITEDPEKLIKTANSAQWNTMNSR
jgi:hypothetical protein